MANRTQKLIEAFRQSPDLENIYVGRLVLWAALPAGGLPCGLLLILGILSGEFVTHVALYALLVLLYLGLLLLIAIPSRASRRLWRHLWAFLLVIGLVSLAIQSLISESFLQPIIFLVPLIYAALVYPPVRVAVVAMFFLGLMNLGVWLSGQTHPVSYLFPTFGYGTFMAFTYAFVRLSIQQVAARREADRLADDLAHQRDYLKRLAEITASLTRDLDLATVLEQAAAEGRALAHAVKACIWLRKDDGGQAVVRAAAVPWQEPDVTNTSATLWGAESIDYLTTEASGTRLIVPLVFKGATIGVLELQESPIGPFTGEDARLLQPFADAAAVAIENARLYEQAHMSATLAERNRLARELHDTIAQGLTAVTMQLEAAQRSFERDPARARARLGRAHELARQSLEEVRRSVWTLAAPLIDGQSLSAALEDLTVRFSSRTGLPASYEHQGMPPRIGHAAATQVLRIAQEALQNVEKHAHASAVAVGSAADDRQLRVWVRDDGIGFAPGAPASGNGNGFGLLSLRERARLAGGTLTVESAPGTGTHITVTVPLEQERPGEGAALPKTDPRTTSQHEPEQV